MSGDSELRSVCDLMRLSEPADRILKSAITCMGAEQTRHEIVHPGPGTMRRLHRACAESEIDASGEAVSRAMDRWKTRLGNLDAHRDLRAASRMGARLLLPTDEQWPSRLSDLGLDEPIGIWVRGPGELSDLTDRSVAVVGSRAASTYGLHCARALSFHLVSRGASVISGGAFGIDAASHQAALNAADSSSVGTIAFMASGVDRLYPQGNRQLLEQIADTFLIASEAPLGATAMRHRFLTRNRLIAACSSVTVVVQAGYRSGAINTAHTAAGLGRPVAAFPGVVTAAEQAGCHRLIRDGSAVLVTGAEDVSELLDGMDPTVPDRQAQLFGDDTPLDTLGHEETRLLSALSATRARLPVELSSLAGLTVAQTRATLGALSVRGFAQNTPTGWVKRRPGCPR